MVHLIPVEMQKSVADHTRFTVVCWDLDWIVECAIFTLSSATLRCIFLFSVQSGTGKLSALFVTNESILARWGEKRLSRHTKVLLLISQVFHNLWHFYHVEPQSFLFFYKLTPSCDLYFKF